MKTSSIIAGIVVLVLIAAGFAWYTRTAMPSMVPQATQETAPAQTSGSTSTPASTVQPSAATPQTVTVTYNGSSFTPSTVTIHVGDTITFVDSSPDPMWVASGVHPTHTVYDGTDRSEHCAAGYTGPTPFDECKASTANYSFTFSKAGTWSFHNHVNPGATGQVVVQ